MNSYFKSALSLIATSLFCSCLQAASIKYTFTFNATSVSALTSYSLTSPSLLTGSDSFISSQVTVISPPASGAILPPHIPGVFFNAAGSVGAVFRASNGTTWGFTGLTSPLNASGTYAFGIGSEIVSGGSTRPVTGSVVIASQPQTNTPEPGALLLSGAGLLLLGLVVKLKRRPA
ncbi:MAG: hypothetical protein M3Y72_03985 [Acidobacteriota bacterium]|nr:hypothetical protein [Acidobacteriota bacterium]